MDLLPKYSAHGPINLQFLWLYNVIYVHYNSEKVDGRHSNCQLRCIKIMSAIDAISDENKLLICKANDVSEIVNAEYRMCVNVCECLFLYAFSSFFLYFCFYLCLEDCIKGWEKMSTQCPLFSGTIRARIIDYFVFMCH